MHQQLVTQQGQKDTQYTLYLPMNVLSQWVKEGTGQHAPNSPCLKKNHLIITGSTNYQPWGWTRTVTCDRRRGLPDRNRGSAVKNRRALVKQIRAGQSGERVHMGLPTTGITRNTVKDAERWESYMPIYVKNHSRQKQKTFMRKAEETGLKET